VAVYLIYRDYVPWRLPVIFILSAYVTAAVCPIVIDHPEAGPKVIVWPFLAEGISVGLTYVNYQVFLGGLMLGACVLTADMTSRPMTATGQVFFAVCAGVLTILLRLYSAIPVPCYAAILAVNTLAPAIDRVTRRHLRPRLP